MFPKWLLNLFPDELQAWRKQAEEDALQTRKREILKKAGQEAGSPSSSAPLSSPKPPPHRERPPIPLVAYLQGVEVGDPLQSESLTIFPLFQRLPSPLQYFLLEEALERGCRLTEVHAQGIVSRIKVENPLELPVLFIDGHEIQGGKQNRILNASFLLPPNASLELPVSCVERGRWRPTTETFRVGSSIFSAGARRKKHRSVSQSLRQTASFDSDQGAVWRDIHTYLQTSQTRSSTESLEDVIKKRADQIEAMKESLPYPSESVGQIVFLGEAFLALDLLDDPKKAQILYPKFLSSYIHEAIDPLEPLPKAPLPSSLSKGQDLLESLWQIVADAYPSLGLGQELRFHEPPLRGSALLAQDTLLHLEVFPEDSPSEHSTTG